MTLSDEEKDYFHWWLENLSDMYKPIQLPPISIEFSSDGSKYDDWTVVMGKVSTGGAWTASEFEIHIGTKEMIAIYYALRSFVDKLSGQHVRVQCDNTTAVSVINIMGTTHSPEFNAIAQGIWQFCRQRKVTEWLFGDNLSQEINNISLSNKVSSEARRLNTNSSNGKAVPDNRHCPYQRNSPFLVRSRTSNYHHPNRCPPNYAYKNNPNKKKP